MISISILGIITLCASITQIILWSKKKELRSLLLGVFLFILFLSLTLLLYNHQLQPIGRLFFDIGIVGTDKEVAQQISLKKPDNGKNMNTKNPAAYKKMTNEKKTEPNNKSANDELLEKMQKERDELLLEKMKLEEEKNKIEERLIIEQEKSDSSKIERKEFEDLSRKINLVHERIQDQEESIKENEEEKDIKDKATDKSYQLNGCIKLYSSYNSRVKMNWRSNIQNKDFERNIQILDNPQIINICNEMDNNESYFPVNLYLDSENEPITVKISTEKNVVNVKFVQIIYKGMIESDSGGKRALVEIKDSRAYRYTYDDIKPDSQIYLHKELYRVLALNSDYMILKSDMWTITVPMENQSSNEGKFCLIE